MVPALPFLPAPVSDLEVGSLTEALRVPLTLAAAGGLGTFASGIVQGSLPLMLAGAVLWLGGSYVWERASGPHSTRP
ncbi:hypothetical protein [Rubrivirga sp.]|uniref:hypothetical protein n=1 Tax=Rubrivirga sp. TaxID=1885344 RepID=UPI003C77E9F0